MLELLYTINEKDISSYNRDALGIKRIQKNFIKSNAPSAIITSIIMSLFWTYIIFKNIYLTYWFFYIVLLEFFVIFILLIYFVALVNYLLLDAKRVIRLRKGISNNIKLTIKDDEIISEITGIKSVYKWASIKDIYQKKHNILIFISDLTLIGIPMKIFNSKEDIDSCWNYIQECYDKAHLEEENHG